MRSLVVFGLYDGEYVAQEIFYMENDRVLSMVRTPLNPVQGTIVDMTFEEIRRSVTGSSLSIEEGDLSLGDMVKLLKWKE